MWGQFIITTKMFSRVFRTFGQRLAFKPSSFFSNEKRSIFYRKLKEEKGDTMKRFSYMNVTISCFVFAACFAVIPLYRTFCESVGISGDVDKKEYTFDASKINNIKKYKVSFSGEVDPDIQWDFEPVERELVVSAGETAIVFYRLYNREPKPIVGFSVYNIYPEECNAYFSKIQCFCFNQQLINPNEELLLPIFFYIEPEINDDPDCSRVTLIKVAYTFLKSAKQNLAKFAEEELKRVEDNKKKLNEIRAQKMNMTLDSYLQYLDSEEAKNREEAELKHEQQVKNRQDAEIARLKHAREFDQDLLLAELISKEFDSNPEDGVEGAKEAAAAS